jgi:hypothetical protein
MIFLFRSFPDLFTQLIISPIKDCEVQTIKPVFHITTSYCNLNNPVIIFQFPRIVRRMSIEDALIILVTSFWWLFFSLLLSVYHRPIFSLRISFLVGVTRMITAPSIENHLTAGSQNITTLSFAFQNKVLIWNIGLWDTDLTLIKGQIIFINVESFWWRCHSIVVVLSLPIFLFENEL